MLFPDDALSDQHLIDLAEAITRQPTPPIDWLPCDRYVARSCLQKAVRRGEVALAQRALANLFLQDRRSAWRAVTIIALEEVGVANAQLLARIIVAHGNRSWRTQMGGDWPVLAELARQMAESYHCQAACDLLLWATIAPALDTTRTTALELTADALAEHLWDHNAPPTQRAVAALALGGALAEGQRHRDPAAVFDIFEEAGQSSHVVPTCRAAWKISRNPMAMLIPLVWDEWLMTGQDHAVTDDPMPPVQMLDDVPGYSLDQFTRIGNNVSRALVKECPDLRDLLEALGIPTGKRSQTLGDALFLMEGGLLRRRVVWPFGQSLREPQRMLPTTARLGIDLQRVAANLASKRRQIAILRRHHFHHTTA